MNVTCYLKLLMLFSLWIISNFGILHATEECHLVKEQFFMQSVGNKDIVPSSRIKDPTLEVCHHDDKQTGCCTRQMEHHYHRAAERDFKNVLNSTSFYLADLLKVNIQYYQEAFFQTLDSAENSTNMLFANTYSDKIPLVQRRGPIQNLFLDLRMFLNNNNGDEMVDIETSIERFFDELFPLVFHNIILNPEVVKQLEDDYRECLMESRDLLTPKPFKDIPSKVAHRLSKALKIARLFLQSLSVALETINTGQLQDWDIHCTRALTRLEFCSHCGGHVYLKPCTDFCHNVMRGCLAGVLDLSMSWNQFIEGLDLLASTMNGLYNFEKQILTLHQQISNAIMHAMETGPKLYQQVTEESRCGLPKMSSHTTSDTQVHSGLPLDGASVKRPSTHLVAEIEGFLKSLKSTKGFFENLADTMCESEKYSAEGEASCWNGQEVDRYTKYVPPKTYEAQVRDNPEVAVPVKKDVTIETIANKLVTMKKLLHSKASQALVQGDEESPYQLQAGGDAGVETGGYRRGSHGDSKWDSTDDWSVRDYQKRIRYGSGYGSGMMADDDDEDHWQYSGSGSGYRDLQKQPPYKQVTHDNSKQDEDDFSIDDQAPQSDLYNSGPLGSTSCASLATVATVTTIAAIALWLNG